MALLLDGARPSTGAFGFDAVSMPTMPRTGSVELSQSVHTLYAR